MPTLIPAQAPDLNTERTCVGQLCDGGPAEDATEATDEGLARTQQTITESGTRGGVEYGFSSASKSLEEA